MLSLTFESNSIGFQWGSPNNHFCVRMNLLTEIIRLYLIQTHDKIKEINVYS